MSQCSGPDCQHSSHADGNPRSKKVAGIFEYADAAKNKDSVEAAVAAAGRKYRKAQIEERLQQAVVYAAREWLKKEMA